MTRQKKTWILASMALSLLLLASVVYSTFAHRKDPQFELVQELQAKAFSKNAAPETRRELFEQMRTESEKLSDAQRQTLRKQAHTTRQQDMQQRMSTYFELNDEQRVAYLDEQIDEMELRRKEREERINDRENGGQERRRGDGVGRRGGPSATAEQRSERRRGFLAMSSAEDRAKFMSYIDDLNQRREERGLKRMERPKGRRGR